MKYSNTITRLSLNSLIFLFSAMFSIAGFENVKAQEIILNSGLRFGDSELNANEEAMLRKYLENPETPTDQGNGYPPIWDNPIPQDKPHGIIVSLESNPRINDIPLEQYDYIGGFYTDDYGELRCGGAGYWPDTLGIIFALQRDNPDTPEKDGFSFMEQIYFKLFSFNTMKDYFVDVTEFDPDFYATDKWGSLGLSRLTDIQALEDLDFFIEPSLNPICLGDGLSLSAQEFIGTGGNYLYQWSSDDPDLGFDYTIQNPPPVFPTQTTTFTLIVQDGTFVSEHSLTIQVRQEPNAFAGQDGQVCANDVYELSGEAQNFSSVEWITNGDGEIADPFSLQTTYTPGPADLAAGQVTIVLDVMPKTPCDFIASDQLQLDILPLPDVNAGEDIIGCTTDDIEVSAVASDYSAVEWTTSGDGYFENPNDLSSLYIADGNDFQNGVSLYICVEASAPCIASVCDTVTVEYVPGPTVLGPSSKTGCENSFFSISGIAYNYSSTEWTTQGDGTFENPFVFATKYYPGVQDIENQGTIITLNAYPFGNCETATKNVTINIVNLPEISFGPNSENICMGDEFLQLNATVEHTNSISWSTNGDGTFDNNTISNPKYYPGTEDEQNGQFELELLAYPLPYCSTSTIESLTVTYQDNPVSFAGEDATICEDETFILADANAESFDGLSWSGGNGTFSNSTALNPEYIPSPDEFGTTITLCLDASPISPCDVAASDCLNLTVVQLPDTDAGDDANICEGETWQLDGTVLYTNNFTWTTSGDGEFSDNQIENPIYIPGTADIANGSVILTLTAQPNAPCTAIAEDATQLDIQRAVTASAGTDATICDIDDHLLSTAEADRYETLTWSTSGDGNFSDPTDENPTYFPGTNDIVTGSVELTLLATAIAPCADDITDTKTLTIIRSVEADAGDDANICEGETLSLDGTVLYTNNFTWSTSGDGEFSNATIENPVYTPGPADIANGSVILTITAQPNAPCTAIAEDATQLDIQLAVTATAGSDAVICDTENHMLSSADAANYETLTWSTSGDGNFSDPTDENPIYSPGANDIETGNVELTLNATAIAPCAGDITDTKTLNIIRSVETDAGADAGICEGESWQLDGTVLYSNDFSWSTSGDGEFSDDQIENPVYTPGPADIANGSVILTLTAQPNAPCTAIAEDAMQLEIQLAVTATAGSDAVICDIDEHLLSTAEADHYETLTWSTSGDGNFSDPTDENPIYSPGANDIETGNVELTLNATAIAPCAGDITNTKTLTIIRSVETDAGDDANICEGETLPLDGSVLYTDDFIWSTSGDGTFSNATIENPIYTPGTDDIASGLVTLTLTAQPNVPCTTIASDLITLEITPHASLIIGSDVEVCGTESILLDDVSADNFSDLIWTTSGDGTFSNPQVINPEYFPGTDDLNNNQVILTLTLNPIAPCTGDLAADKVLLVALPPTAQAGDDITICDDQIELSGGAENFNSIIWTTNGDGAFNNPSLLNATYFPGEGDFSAGQVQLTLTATANEPCSSPATDALNINFEELELENDFVVDKEVQLGNLLFFSFSVSSQVSGEYAWYFNGEVLPDQGNPFLIIYNMQPENAGNYQGTFTNPCGTVETNIAYVQVVEDFSQDIEISEGWSGLSSFVTPDNPALESVFSDIVNDLIIMSNDQGVYWPGQNINTLGDLSVVQGYQIKLSNNTTLSVDGKIRYPLNELTIQPGWSFLPVNTSCAISTLDQFTDLDGITMIKEIAGARIYWPELGINTLNELVPGKAYLILNSSGNPVTFKYNGCTKSYSGMNINPLVPKMQTPWNDLSATTTTHVIGLSAQALDELKSGDVIGVFNASGVCSGLEVVNQNENASLIAFGDEMLTETTEGLVDGEEMNFRVYRPSTGETFDANATFDNKSSQQNVFTKNGVSVIQKFTLKSATGVNDHEIAGDNIRIYPNPTTGVLNVSIENTSNEKLIIDLMNASGQVLISKQSTGKNDFSIQIDDQPKGVYYLKVVAGETVKVEKVILK